MEIVVLFEIVSLIALYLNDGQNSCQKEGDVIFMSVYGCLYMHVSNKLRSLMVTFENLIKAKGCIKLCS